MPGAWDQNVEIRHKQILEGKDLSFSKLLVPEIIGLLQELSGFSFLSVLDVGCGSGVLSKILSGYVSQIVGVDPSPTSVSIARKHTEESKNVVIECASIEDYSQSHPHQFDFAVAHMVLQAVEMLALALKSISFSLKQNGVFVFTIPHPCFWAMYKNEISESGYKYHKSSYHLIEFTISNDQNPLPSRVPYFHRALEVYSNALYQAGFVIERIREPFPSQELMKEYSRSWIYPRYMIVVCRKYSNGEA